MTLPTESNHQLTLVLIIIVLSVCLSVYLSLCLCILEATWHGRRNCRFTLHYENGFTLTTDADGVVENGGSGADTSRGAVAQTILWHYPFEKLQMSSDDGRRLLWLDFGDDGEQVIYTVFR